MKRKIILIFSVLLILGVGVVAFAYNAAETGRSPAMSCCCCKGDSCPMKNKDAASVDGKANCDCCKGDSCPMKGKPEHTDSMVLPVGQATTADTKSCDCPCCHGKDSKTGS